MTSRAILGALLFCALVACARRPGATKVNAKDGQSYAWIPAGTFLMGCSPGDTCDDREKPAHNVTLSKGFWMAQTDTTVGAYKRFAQANNITPPTGKDISGNELNSNDSLPVVAVTWDQAVAYCTWAGMRLPTEAEWEYSGRGGTTGARYGNVDDIAWDGDNSGRQPIDATNIWNTDQKDFYARLSENQDGPKPVGQKKPNAYMLFDMLGNELQWTADWYDTNYYASSPSQDPKGPASGTLRSVRGSAWADVANSVPAGVRISYRYYGTPANPSAIISFRCAGD